MLDEPVRVDAYSGGRGEERPRAFWIGEGKVGVAEILHSWIEEEKGGRERRRFFEVRAAGGGQFTLYHDERLGVWFLRMDKVRPCRV